MSGVLVDTHMALWALGSPQRLTAAERAVLVDPGIDRRLSPMSVWEAAIQREAGRLRAPRNLAAVLMGEFRMLDVTAALLERSRAITATRSTGS